MSTTYGPGRFEAIVNRTIMEIESNVKTIGQYAFANCTQLTSAKFPKATSIGNSAFRNCTSLTSYEFPQTVASIGQYAFNGSGIESVHLYNANLNAYVGFNGCKYLKTFVCERNTVTSTGTYLLQGCTALTHFDALTNSLNTSMFTSCTALNTLILRRSDGITAGGISNSGVYDSAAFKSGGTGGVVYIPKVLYDHLGDGSTLDYKAAANWSTIDGYGTITWLPIEGSYYETHYADGTLIT